MTFILFNVLAVIFLLGTFFLTALNSAFRRLHKREAKEQIKLLGNVFFYRPFHSFFFPQHEYEGLFFSAHCAQAITRFCYPVFTAAVLLTADFMTFSPFVLHWPWGVVYFLGFLIAFFIVGDFIPRILGAYYPVGTLRLCAVPASLFMYAAFPVTFIFLKLSRALSHMVYFDYMQEPVTQANQEILEIIQEVNPGPRLDPHERKLIESVVTFRDLIAREVMVPRVDVFSLSADTTIKQAAKLLQPEGYSRTPVFKNSVDNVVGVLMYKDVLNKYTEFAEKNDPKILEAPIDTILKGVIYTPETKKISHLLQEFRKKQMHLAIVVDEYGGTEGIVTIEDILEEIVGEIADEYDEEEALFTALPNGSWVVDAGMRISEAEEQFNITIPQEGDYDTIGGYIFHKAGSIPSKGFIIHQEDFDMEILRSNDRCVEKVKIKPLRKKTGSADKL